MTLTETAAAMRRLADACDKVASRHGNGSLAFPKGCLSEEAATGAAGLLCYLRDCFTVSQRENYNRADILVLLEIMSRDAEIFPGGIGQLFWQMENEDDAA